MVSAPVSGDQVLEMVRTMHRATQAMIEGCEGHLAVITRVDVDLTAIVKDLVADLYFLQVSLGIVADFYGRDLARSRSGDPW